MLLIHLLLCASMIVIRYSSLPDKSLSGSKRSLLNNEKRWWDGDKDEQDLIDLMRFKETNSSSSSSSTGRHDKGYEIESSLLEIEEYQQKNRQFIYGTCTCSSTSFTCSPTILVVVSSYTCGAYSKTCPITSCPSLTHAYYTCSAAATCSTVCSSVSKLGSCSQSCTTFTSLSALYYTDLDYFTYNAPPYGTSVGGDGITTTCSTTGTVFFHIGLLLVRPQFYRYTAADAN